MSKKVTKTSHALAWMVAFVSAIILLSQYAHADCPYDQTRNVYDCTGTIVDPVVANPRMVSPGQYDMRSSTMVQRGNGWGPRRQGGCAAVLKHGTVSHYDCTTHALEAVPETRVRAQYQNTLQRMLAEERGESGTERAEQLFAR